MSWKQSQNILAVSFALICGLLVSTTSVHALGKEQVLYNFDYNTGTNPYGGLISDAAGNLYGTASVNGTIGAGVVYELLPNGSGQWGYEILYNFCSLPGCADGIMPLAGLIFDAAGNLYGTTSQGGQGTGGFGCGHGCGTVFELSPTAGGIWTEKVLYAFTGGTDGAIPTTSLAMDSSGNLYGTTTLGGADSNSILCAQGCGVIFRLQPSATGDWTETVLHSFCSGVCRDGASPNGLSLDSAGNLYSTTTQFGDHNGGALIQLTQNQKGNWSDKLLHEFGKDFDGQSPNSGLVFDASGNLYGTTNKGGKKFGGTIFQLSPRANGQWSETILYNFCSAENCADGGYPAVGLTMDPAGRLYGANFGGGNAGFGDIFGFERDETGQWRYAIFYDSPNVNLDAPVIIDAAGNFYSTTTTGGEFNVGTAFEVPR
jgi:uncharacterized repeat protein (TIGR03803 family)